MASPITTGGFQVQAQPGINFLPPSAFSSGVSNILPNISHGASLITQLQGISDEAQARPIRQQLQQIQYQEALAKLAQIPVDQQLQQTQLSEAQKRAAVPIKDLGPLTLQGGNRTEFPAAIDDNGNPTGPSDFVTNPLVGIRDVSKYGPGGIVTHGQEISVLKTPEQLDSERMMQAAKLEDIKAQASQRLRPREFRPSTVQSLINTRDSALQDAQDARDAGDEETALSHEKTAAQMDAIINQGGRSRDGNKISSDTALRNKALDIGLPVQLTEDLMKTVNGASAIAKLSTLFKAQVNGHTVDHRLTDLTPDERKAVEDAKAGFASSVNTPAPMFNLDATSTSAAPVSAQPTLQNADQVKAAVRAGVLSRDQAVKILREQFGFQ